MQRSAEPAYIPAARWRVFSRIYDPVLALTMREGRFRAATRERVSAALPRGGTVVDVGCGTGTFAIGVAAERPDANVVGIDGDPLREAGFDAVERYGRLRTGFGSLDLLSVRSPRI